MTSHSEQDTEISWKVPGIRHTQQSGVSDSQGTEQLMIANQSKCGVMHHQNQHCSLSDRRRIYCQSLRRHHGGFEYDSCRQDQEEDSSVPGTPECQTACYYTGDNDLTHVYVQNDTNSCLSDSESDFGEMCHQQDVHDVQMDSCLHTCNGSEHNLEVSHLQTSEGMNDEPEQTEENLCLCRDVHSGWNSNHWPSLPSPCCNARNAVVVGVEVDVLEEVVYEDTEIVQTQTMFDGCLEDHMMDSCYCDQLFFM